MFVDMARIWGKFTVYFVTVGNRGLKCVLDRELHLLSIGVG